MLTFAKLKPQNVRAPSLQVMLQGLLVAFAFLLSLGAHAQSSACVANETAQNFAVPAGGWLAGSVGPLS